MELALQITTLVVLAAGLWFSFRQLRQIRVQQGWEFDMSRRMGALNYSFFRNEAVRNSRQRLDGEFGPPNPDRPIDIDVINDAFTTNPALQHDLMAVLGHIENIALAVRSDVIDRNVVFFMSSDTCLRYVDAYSNYIADIRESRPHYLEEWFTVLDHCWRKLRSSGDRPVLPALKPFPRADNR